MARTIRHSFFFSMIALSMCSLAGAATSYPQNALDPAGPAAGAIAWLWWLLFWICTAVFVGVMILSIWSVYRSKRDRIELGDRFVVFAGIVFPTIVLTVLLILSLQATVKLARPESDLTIRVIGHQFWWDVQYPEQNIHIANELHIPAGRPVKIELQSADVIHSFWVPNLHGKMDMIPNQPTVTWLHADKPGQWRGQCAEFCGVQHALMALVVVAHEPTAFEQWVEAHQSIPDQVPQSRVEADMHPGQRVFLAAQCHACHAIKGTVAHGRAGPDLTHIGSRRTLASGTLPNSSENLARWIAKPQEVKPGNLMPGIELSETDIAALVDYLERLK